MGRAGRASPYWSPSWGFQSKPGRPPLAQASRDIAQAEWPPMSTLNFYFTTKNSSSSEENNPPTTKINIVCYPYRKIVCWFSCFRYANWPWGFSIKMPGPLWTLRIYLPNTSWLWAWQMQRKAHDSTSPGRSCPSLSNILLRVDATSIRKFVYQMC